MPESGQINRGEFCSLKNCRTTRLTTAWAKELIEIGEEAAWLEMGRSKSS